MCDQDHEHPGHQHPGHQHPHHHGDEGKNQFNPSLKAVFSNWQQSKEPFLVKVGMVFRNNWIKIRRGSSCCGHHGEVGC